MRAKGENFGMKSRTRQTIEGIVTGVVILGALTAVGIKMYADHQFSKYFNNLPLKAYYVQEGDRLHKFADDYLKPETQREMDHMDIVDRVLELNPGLEPTRLRPGQKIYLPSDIE